MKKTLCFILALVMVISMVPMASAADGSESPALVYRFLEYSNGYWVEDTDGGYHKTMDSNNFVIGGSSLIKMYFYNGSEYVPLKLSDVNFTDNIEIKEDDLWDALVVEGVKCTEGQISYSDETGSYSIPVSIGLPFLGFYSTEIADEDSFIGDSLMVTEDTNVFYFVSLDQITITDCSFSAVESGVASMERISDQCYKFTIDTDSEFEGNYSLVWSDVRFGNTVENVSTNMHLYAAPKLMFKQEGADGEMQGPFDSWSTYAGLSTDALFFLVDGETETPVSFEALSWDGPVTLSYRKDTGTVTMEATSEGKAMVWLTDNADAEEFFVYVSAAPGGEGGDGGDTTPLAEGLYYRDMAGGLDQPLYEDKENYNLEKVWPGVTACTSRTVKFYFLDSEGNEHELGLSDLSFTPNLSGALTRQTVDSSTTGDVIDFGAEAPGMGSVSYTVGDNTYVLEVDVGLPDFGFYSQSEAKAEYHLTEAVLQGDANSFYFIAANGSTITDARLVSGFENIAQIEAVSGLANCYKITVTGEPENGNYSVEFDGVASWGGEISGWKRGIRIRVVHPAFGFRYAGDPGIITTSWCAVPGDSAAVKFVWNDGSEDTELGLADITLPDFLEASEEFGVVTLTAKSTGTGVISYGDADMVVSVRESVGDNALAAVVDGYTVGFGMVNEGGVIDIVDGQGGFSSGVGSERKDEYSCISGVFGTQFVAGIKKTDSDGNTYYEPAENVNIIPLEMWIENIEGNASGISFSPKGHEMLVSTFPDNSVNIYGRRGYSADTTVCALLIVDTGKTEELVQVSCSASIFRVVWIDEQRPMGDTVEAVNARLQEIANDYTPGDSTQIELKLAPQDYYGTIVIPEEFRGIDMMDLGVDIWGTISNGSHTVLNGAVDLNGTMLSSIESLCFKATDSCKTAIYGGYLSNMNGCSFWDYDIAVDASEGGITLTKSNFFVNNDIAVKLDLSDPAVIAFNRSPWDSNVFLNNGTAIQIKAMPFWYSIYNFRVVNSNFINNETDFDIQTPGTFYMYKNYYGDIHNQSLDLSMEEILAGLAAVKTDTDVRGQQFISSNSPNIEIAKGTKAKVITNPRWKYPTLEVWSGWHDINLGFDYTQPIATFAEIEYYTNVLISDWTQETQIVSEEADELIIDAESFDEAGKKAVAVVDKDENALGSWTFED